jgi:hypothetical protein
VNDVHLIKIFDQRLNLHVMFLCLGLNPMAFQLFVSYPSTLFDLTIDENLDNRELRLSAYPVLPLKSDPMANGYLGIRNIKPFSPLILSFHLK